MGERERLLDNNKHTTDAVRNWLPVTVSWEEVQYRIDVGKSILPWKRKLQKPTQKFILRGISGLVKPGQLLAIMGSTGAGKTTLLDVLARRKDPKYVTGQVLYNGQSPNNFPKRITAYVTQDDCLMATQTVRETLMFNADLKLPASLTSRQRAQRVEQVIQELSLENVGDSLIGSQFIRGVSGGEKKRVSIGCELITDPGLLLLDEPTTGLDAYNSFSVMKQINQLAKAGRTIICTIHQPRSTIFELFDQLMLLSAGKVVYFGPARDAVDYFAGLNIHCRPFLNPADFFIDVVIKNEKKRKLLNGKDNEDIENTPIPEGDESDGLLATIDLVSSYESSQLHSQMIRDIQQSHLPAPGERYQETELPDYATSFPWQLFVVSKRIIRNFIRNPTISYIQLAQTLFLSFLIGTIYWQIGLTQSSIQDRQGALFFVLTNQAFSTLSSLNLFLAERDLFNRERASYTYRTSVYFFGKTLVEAPLMIIYPIIFCTLTYWMIGFQSDVEKFFTFLGTIVLFTIVVGSMFLMLGALSPNQTVATVLSPILVILFLLFGGFYLNIENIPRPYRWIREISFFRYAFESIAVNEFRGLKFEPNQGGGPDFPTGEDWLKTLGFEGVVISTNIAYLLVMLVVYRSLAFVFLKFLYKEKR